LSANGLTLFFHSDRPPGAEERFDLWMCARASPRDSFGAPVNLGPKVNSSAGDYAPTLSADGLTLFFSSDRPGGRGRSDLWMCMRASPSDPFGEPVNLGPKVNTSAMDEGPSLSADSLTLFFNSNRPGGRGGKDLWMMVRWE